jgi:hypothetical protein
VQLNRIRTPRAAATSSAESYPASTWRMPPIPGSLVSTRARFARPARYHRPTTPGRRDRPPDATPPPWRIEIHLAPDADVGGITRQGGPAERSLSLAEPADPRGQSRKVTWWRGERSAHRSSEQRPDVGRHEAGELECALVAALSRLVADRVASCSATEAAPTTAPRSLPA